MAPTHRPPGLSGRFVGGPRAPPPLWEQRPAGLPAGADGMEIHKGIPVSPGVVVGRVYLLDDERQRIPRRSIPRDGIPAQIARLNEALERARDELSALRDRAQRELGEEAAKIFGFHLGLLADPSLTGPMRSRVETEGVTAEFSAAEEFQRLAAMFSRMGDESFVTKVDDVLDLERRVLRALIGERRSRVSGVGEAAVIVAHALTPSQAASFDRSNVVAFATETGGRTSHTAIVAQAMGIPAVVGVARLTQAASEGDAIIIDGDRGVVVLNPSADTLASYGRHIERMRAFSVSLGELADQPAVTTDGARVELHGNIEFAHEAATVIKSGGDGVGLFRTEFLWLVSDHEPTEEEQYLAYRTTVEMLGGKPATLRTFDLGADKVAHAGVIEPEANPFLGLRSIRYCLQNLPMFKRQLRAILRAGAHGPVKIMFPLITTTMELRQARMVLNDVKEDLAEEGIAHDPNVGVGMMVEAPSAALMASTFAREVDFFSIGTNDLVQYVLAVDRTNEHVAPLYTPAHPAVLKLLKDVIRAARREGIDVSCCGEMAGEIEYTMLLLGFGLRSLSLSPTAIPRVKRVIRSVDMMSCERLARRVGSFDSERQIAGFLRDAVRKIIPEAFDGRAVEDSA